MQSLLFILWLTAAPLTPESGKLTLTASKERPFGGELIDITLTIEAFNQTGLELRIPWQFQEPGWQPRHDEWIAIYSKSVPGSIPVLYQGKTIYVPRVKFGQHQLHWKYRLPARVENDSLVLGAATLGSRSSSALHLEVRSLPVMLPSPREWYLGVGPFKVTAQWQPPQVSLGEETLLELAISGAGDMAGIASPKLTELPDWDASKVLLEALPAVMQQGQRVVRFKVRPRQQQLVFAPLKVRYFHPEQERWMMVMVPIPPLSVASAREVLQLPAGSTVEDAWHHLPQVLRDSYSSALQTRRSTDWIPWAIALPAGVFLVLLLLYAVRCWQAFTMTPAKRWRLAARFTRRQQRHMTLTPEHAYILLKQLLQRGAGYPGTLEHNQLLKASEGLPVEQEIQQLLSAIQKWQYGPSSMQQSVIESLLERLLSAAEEIPC